MSEKDTGGPAFPLSTSCGITAEVNGMTLRDYFAAKSLQGYLANPTSFGLDVPEEAKSDPHKVAEICAAFAYIVSDAMLEARK